MTESPRIEGLLRRIRREIRRRRAEYYGLRGAFWGAGAGVAVMLAKQGIGARAPWIAGGLVVLGLLVGLAYGAARGIRRGDVARVADRAFGLDDRVATTLEWADRPDRTRLVDTLVSDTVARVESLERKRVVKRVVPREGQLLALPVLACLVLAITPPIPLPSGRLPDFLSSTEEEREERTSSSMLEETTRQLAKDPTRARRRSSASCSRRWSGSAARAAATGAATRWKGWRRSRAARAIGPSRLCRRRSTRCGRWTSSSARARACAAGASPSAAGAARTVRGATARARRTRISARVRGSCPARAGAARPRAKRPSVCVPIRSTSASRANRARA